KCAPTSIPELRGRDHHSAARESSWAGWLRRRQLIHFFRRQGGEPRNGGVTHAGVPRILVLCDGEVEVNSLFRLPHSLINARQVHVDQRRGNRSRFGFQLLIFSDRIIVFADGFVTLGQRHPRLGGHVGIFLRKLFERRFGLVSLE